MTVVLPAEPATACFEAIGTTNSIVATVPDELPDAVEIARAYLAALDLAASRFRPDSELSRLNEAARRGPVTAIVSPLLARLLDTALRVGRLTDGLVDPTVGAALVGVGYDDDLAAVLTREQLPARRPYPSLGWDRLRLDLRTRVLTMPRGMLLDLGATGKALLADDLARLLTRDLSGGFLVDLGGDIAVAGDLPQGGWPVGVQGPDGRCLQVVRSHGQALATSSTALRRWRTRDGVAHHIIDPRTGDSAEPVWQQVTCGAPTAVEANTATTAAVVLGEQAPQWLIRHGLAALLLRADGTLVRVGGWPQERS